MLDDIERANAKIHGYGSKNFARNLNECFRHLSERDIGEQDLQRVEEFAYDILQKPIELLEGVAETVAELAGRHELTMFTKGDPEEQILRSTAPACALISSIRRL